MMSSLDQRVILYKSATSSWTDYSIQLNDWNNAQTAAFSMLPGDYLYISSFLPFNHKYFKVTTANAVIRSPYIEVNDLATWSPVVDILDHTGSLSGSGVIQFTRDQDKTWGRAPNNKRDIPVMALCSTVAYDSYWMRISFPTTDPSSSPVTFTLSYIGQCFSSDSDLFAEYPSLRNTGLLNAWQTGKSDWNDQHLLAACYIAKHMRQRGLIMTNEQLLDIASLRSPSVHKVAQIIWSGLGAKNYEKEIAMAEKAFSEAMVMGQPQVDTDHDGLKGRADRSFTTSRATR